ncbi:MAG: hypothetical protein C0518_04255 [Opitutus sp.]|nr:hypothetical protein [Opitutus sp.]
MNHPSAPIRVSPFARARVAVAALLLGVIAVFTSTGCVAVAAAGAAGAGVAWIRGALEVNLEENLDQVYKASQNAVRGLEFAPVSERKSGVDAAILARTALDKRVEIVLKKIGPNTTHVSIRVGVFGDETMSMAVLDRIKAGL